MYSSTITLQLVCRIYNETCYFRFARGLPVGGYNVNNIRYADDTTLIATSVADG